MIKLIVTILFKSSAVIKVIFISLLHEARFLFKGLSEILGSGFDSINYHIFQPIRLIRFPEVRDLLIFPAWLTHYVHAFKSDVERISVSGNIKFKYD